jgi:dihydropteroate synthase
MQGKPRTMQTAPQYPNGLVETIDAFFDERIRVCLDAGILHKQLMLDPGFGFGKTVLDNLRLIKQVAAFHKYGLPLLLGVSRKSTLAAVVGDTTAARLSAGLTLAVFAAAEGVTMIRTHDVFETKYALCMLNALYEENDRG